MKLQHPDRVGDQKPVEVGDREDHVELLKRNGWYEVEAETGKPKE